MPDPNFKYTPEDGWNNQETFPTNPPKESTRGLFQLLFDQVRDFINNTLIVWVSGLYTTITNALTTHKTSADHDGRYYTEAEADAKYETKTDLTNNRKLSATGDFTGSWQGYAFPETATGVKADLDEHITDNTNQFNDVNAKIDTKTSDLISRGINVKFPPASLTPAVGDGVADDTAAIQAILDYQAQNSPGSIIYFPSGTYVVNSTLTISPYQTIVGNGFHTKGTRIIKGASFPHGQPMFKNVSYNVSTGDAYIQFRDIELNGNSDKTEGSSLIDIQYCWWFELRDCRLRDSYQGIKAQNGTQLQLNGLTTISSHTIGVELINQEFRAIGATIEFNGTNVIINNTNAYDATVNIESCYMEVDEADTAGVVIKNGTRRVNLKGCYIYSHSEYGDCVIIEPGAHNNKITDNNIIGNITINGYNNIITNNGTKARTIDNNFNFTDEIITDAPNNLLPNPLFTEALNATTNWNTEVYSSAVLSVDTTAGYKASNGGRLKCAIGQNSNGIIKRTISVTPGAKLYTRVDVPKIVPKCSVLISFYSTIASKYYNFNTQAFDLATAAYTTLKPGQNRLAILTGASGSIQIRVSVQAYNIAGISDTQELLYVYAGHTRDTDNK